MDINQIVEKIAAKRIPCLFVSPHLDDTVFSAGGLLLRLAAKAPILIATVFTEGSPPPYTYSSKVFLKNCGGYKSALELYSARRADDIAVCNRIEAKYSHLGLVDASFRKKSNLTSASKILNSIIPEAGHVYPVYRWHIVSGKISADDSATLQEVEKNLNGLKTDPDRTMVFCPLGIGKHVDHIIVKDICKKVFKNLIFWEDFPYNLAHSGENYPDSMLALGELDIYGNEKIKNDVMSMYKNQVSAAFGGNIPEAPERYHALHDRINNIFKLF